MSELPVAVAPANPSDAEPLSEVAAVTFPLACPPELDTPDIEKFIAAELSRARFDEYLAAPDRIVLKAVAGSEIIGYAMLIAGESANPDVVTALGPGTGPVIELSKIYVLPGHHGGGVAAALMTAALDTASAGGFARIWLGVNQKNERAQRFYAKQGFQRAGTKVFTVGTRTCHDYVLQRPL